MGTGFLEVVVETAYDGMPIKGAKVTVMSGDTVLYDLVTDESGLTEKVALEAPDAALANDVNYEGIPYSVVDLKVEAKGFITLKLIDEQILDTETSIVYVHMTPAMENEKYAEAIIPPHCLVSGGHQSEVPPIPPETSAAEEALVPAQIVPRVLNEVIIPEFITVHLGRPDVNAPNVRVPFIYYIKNSASHEIYSTWPAASLEANIYCIISLTLNRIFT
ncbi:MAG: hypothetical protein LBI27_04970 [Clostridiales bacterium]|jgi:hypothetical protein|nr:hypothetical protein [Clostridiales bacterium]